MELLRSGLSLFVTHGGQNSFTEALAHGVPLVVCPGFGDQVTNGRKAEALGVGLQVPRPWLQNEESKEVAQRYKEEVKGKVRRVMQELAIIYTSIQLHVYDIYMLSKWMGGSHVGFQAQ